MTGRDAKEWERSRVAVTRQLAFYASTPAYKGVLDVHGWGDLQPELNALSKQGEWVAMGERISDEVLEQFAIVTEPENVAGQMAKRFSGTIDRVLCTFDFADDAERGAYMSQLRAA